MSRSRVPKPKPTDPGQQLERLSNDPIACNAYHHRTGWKRGFAAYCWGLTTEAIDRETRRLWRPGRCETRDAGAVNTIGKEADNELGREGKRHDAWPFGSSATFDERA